MAASLAARVASQLGRELPIQTIFEHPVIGDLARRLGLVSEGGEAFDELLCIRSASSEPPLFCMHPGTGLGWAYTNLLAVTAHDQPIYGIQARGFDGRTPPASLDEIVGNGLERIRRVQACGPYRLAGWSFGGMTAHMAAVRLQREGEDVGSLILFDAYPPESVREGERNAATDPDRTWREIALAFGMNVPARAGAAPLDATTMQRLAREQDNVLGHFTLARMEALAAVMANNTVLAARARFDVFYGDIVLFAATRQTSGLDRSRADPELWRPHCSGKLTIIEVDAEHHRMMTPAALKQMRPFLGRL